MSNAVIFISVFLSLSYVSHYWMQRVSVRLLGRRFKLSRGSLTSPDTYLTIMVFLLPLIVTTTAFVLYMRYEMRNK